MRSEATGRGRGAGVFRFGALQRTDQLWPFLQLWLITGLRRWRRGSLRHATEMAHLEAWLAAALDHAARNPALGVEVLKARRLIKGYSNTHARGLSKFGQVMAGVAFVADRPDSANGTRRLVAVAPADEEGQALDNALATIRSF